MKRVIISTDCVADIPEELAVRLRIPMMYYYITTGNGRFQDFMEMDTDSLISYIETHEDFPESSCAPVEEYRYFFDKLRQADPEAVIHISMARQASGGFETAQRASADMPEVYVVDSGVLSSSIAILVLYAMDLARRGCPPQVLLGAIEKKKQKLSCTFMVRSTEYMIRGKRMNERLGHTMDRLILHPLFSMEKSKIILDGFSVGGERRSARSYINYALRDRETIDPAVLFITTTGCSEEFREWLGQEARKRVKWDRVIFQTASATTTCNCGPGSFGFMFARR